MVLSARRVDRLQKLAQEIEASGTRALVSAADVLSREDLDRVAREAVAEFGGIDVVVANAGFGVVGRVETLTVDDFHRQFDTNVYGLLHTIYAALPEIRKRRGSVVLIGSVAGHISMPGNAPYSMSKFAVRALANSLEAELRPDGVAVTLISPGFVESDIRKVDNQGVRHDEAATELPRWLVMPREKAAREIARAIRRRRSEQIVTFHGKVAVFVYRHFPWILRFAFRGGLRARRQPKA